MATIVFKGKAAFEGVHGSFDVIIYPVPQSQKITDNYEEEIVKDAHGFDAAWLARNEHYTFDLACKLLGDTKAHAATGVAFLAPLSTVNITDPGESPAIPALLLGAFQVMPGQDIDLGNTKVGDITFKLRKYADATQNTSANTTPS